MRAAVATVVERFGGLDVAVANAGIAQKDFATVRGISGEEWERVFEVDLLGVWRTVRAALPEIVRAARPDGRDLLRLRLRQRLRQHALRGRQVRRREPRPGAARRAGAARRQRHRRLLRLGRHQARPGRLRPAERRPRPRALARLAAEADQSRRGRRRPRPRHRGARPARLRPQVVALRLRPARPDQPAARQADGDRRQDPRPDRRPRRRDAGGRARAQASAEASSAERRLSAPDYDRARCGLDLPGRTARSATPASPRRG